MRPVFRRPASLAQGPVWVLSRLPGQRKRKQRILKRPHTCPRTCPLPHTLPAAQPCISISRVQTTELLSNPYLTASITALSYTNPYNI